MKDFLLQIGASKCHSLIIFYRQMEFLGEKWESKCRFLGEVSIIFKREPGLCCQISPLYFVDYCRRWRRASTRARRMLRWRRCWRDPWGRTTSSRRLGLWCRGLQDEHMYWFEEFCLKKLNTFLKKKKYLRKDRLTMRLWLGCGRCNFNY